MRLLSFNRVSVKLSEVISKWELQIFVTCHFNCSLEGFSVFFWCDDKNPADVNDHKNAAKILEKNIKYFAS